MILTRHDGQELIDGLSALSLGASAYVVARWGVASGLRSRLGFVFGGLCVFFATRAATVALDSHALQVLNELIACIMPLAALLLVEGALRLHAPKFLKALVVFGAIGTGAALLSPATHAFAELYALGAYVILSLAGVTVLLVLRDHASLSRQENAALDALAVPGVALTLLAITDFVPSSPVGLSGIGSAMLAFVLGANPSSRREARGVLGELMLIFALVVVCEPEFALVFGTTTFAQQVRMGGILLALLLGAAAIIRVRRTREDHSMQTFARALTRADTTTIDHYLNSLADQPLLAGLRVAEEVQLAEYDREGLGNALAARTVWTRSALQNGALPTRPREELGDLMTRTDATHAVLISRAPLRIALFVLPGAGQADAAETDLALFGKLAAIAAKEPACS
jgi:hypothetical protein